MKRILVLGCAGSGKTTFAKQLSEKLDLPIIHLDRHYHQPNWTEPDPDQWRETVRSLTEKPQWIMDGNFSGTFDIRLPRADTIIVLDYTRRVCMTGVLKRTLQKHGQVRSEMAPECPERFDWDFLKFVWNFPKRDRRKIYNALDQTTKEQTVHIFQTRSQAMQWLKLLSK